MRKNYHVAKTEKGWQGKLEKVRDLLLLELLKKRLFKGL